MSQHYQQRKAANERYLATQDRLTIRIPKDSGLKAAIEAHAAERGESVQAFIIRIIKAALDNEST